MSTRTSQAFLSTVLLGLAGCGGAGWRDSRPGSPGDDLPVTRVVLYQNGIGYFERRGEIDGDRFTIRVRRDQIADFLKSLTVVDQSQGGRAVAVALPVDKSPTRQLSDLPPQVRQQGGLLAIAGAFRGASAIVTDSNGSSTGRIVGVEQTQVPGTDPGKPQHAEWRLTLLVDGDTLKSFRVDDIETLKILDPSLSVGLDKALDADLDQAAWKPIDLTVELAGRPPHDVVVSYVVEMPTWRPAYRAVIGEGGKALLQGWAVVDNVSGEDWRQVQLALTAGTPLAFTYDLYTPHYVQRPALSPPETEASLTPPPEAYGGEGNADAEEDFDAGAAPRAATAAPPMAPVPRAPYRGGGAAQGAGSSAHRAVSEEDLERNYHSLVTGSGVGALFRYDLDEPVTVGDRQSALVSIVSMQVPGKEVLFYGIGTGGQNPYRALLLQNQTGLVLEHGPVAIYRSSTFLGEALAGRMEKGSTVFVPYAMDSRVTVFPEAATGEQSVTLAAISNGHLVVESKEYDRWTYDVANSTGDAVTLYVQRQRRTSWSLEKVALGDGSGAADPPQPGKQGVIEEGDNYYVPVALPATGRTKIVVEEETPVRRQVDVTSADGVQAIAAYVASPSADPRVAQLLKKVVDQQNQLGDVTRRLAQLAPQRQALSDRESSERQNLEMLNKTKGNEDLKKQLTQRLADLDKQLDDLTRQYVTISEQEGQIKDNLAALLGAITLDTRAR